MILLHRLGEILARPVKAFAEIRLHPATHRAMMGKVQRAKVKFVQEKLPAEKQHTAK